MDQDKVHNKMDQDKELKGLTQQLRQRKISRRDFLRSAAVLGASLGASGILSGCDQPSASPATPTPMKFFVPEDVNAFPTVEGGEILVPEKTPGPETAPEFEAASPTDIPPRNLAWFCAACSQQFKTNEELIRHAAEKHQWLLPEIKRVDDPTYNEFLVGKVERFDEKNTVFSRTLWDEDYQVLIKDATAKAKPGDWTTFEGNALVAGAIYVDNTAGALHPNYYGYMGHVAGDAGLYGWDDPVNTTQFPVEDPVWMTERVKQVARLYGANLVGITEVNPLWVYSHYFERSTGNYDRVNMNLKYAIVMGIEMEWDWIKQSPDTGASAATALVYSRMAEVTSSLAKYIRMLGYPALPSGNDTGQNIPLAIDAGLGELGRNGLLLSPEYGSRQRICKVFTNLPLMPDKPIDFGIQRYCENCHACAQSCPVEAIRWDDRTTEPTSISNRKGILRWPVNVSKCYLFWRENSGTDCSNCIAACPWTIQNPRKWIETETW
jgi:epoxyqueuosine reductase